MYFPRSHITTHIFYYMHPDREGDEPPFISSPKQSLQNSDFFKSANCPQTLDLFLSFDNPLENELISQDKNSISINIEEENAYYSALFSPSNTAQSLIKRNQNLQIYCLENSMSFDYENEDNNSNEGRDNEFSIYKKRAKRVSKLKEKEKKQMGILEDVKEKDFERYKAILCFFKIFYIAKKQISGIRNDYYSQKTFSAIKNSKADILKQAGKVLLSMIENIFKLPKKKQTSNQPSVDFRIVQFMVIPRFLISKEKIKRFATDEQLQENIGILIIYECLGHYNNESNKKFPQQKHMRLISGLLKQQKGKQKYQKITSINHGGKFHRYHPQEYDELYSKSLEYLTFLDQELKKGKKLSELQESLEKIPSDKWESIEPKQFQFQNQNHQYNEIKDDPKSLGDYLARFEHEQRLAEVPLVKTSSCSIEVGSIQKKKFQKRLNSLPSSVASMEQIKEIKPKNFGMRKSFTMQIEHREFMQKNIIVIPPPKEKKQQKG